MITFLFRCDKNKFGNKMKQLNTLRQFLISSNGCLNISPRRYLLSSSYYCKTAWDARLQSPILKKIEADDFGAKVFHNFEQDKGAHAVDMEIMANVYALASPKMQDFMIGLYSRHRKTESALKVTGATPYALFRNMLEVKDYDLLLHMIEDKMGYGFFLDDFTASMLLDHFIKEKDYKRAARVAYDIMLQENLDAHPLSKALMWHACHHHWKARTYDPVPEATEEVEEDEEDVKYIRVDYVHTPHYDDHFDIPYDVWKLGKSLVMVSEGRQDVMGLSYRLIGLSLFDKYDKAIQLIQTVLDAADQNLAKDAVTTVLECAEAVIAKEPSTEEKHRGLITVADSYPIITQEQKQQYIDQLKELTEKLDTAGKVQEFNLEEALGTYVREAVSKHEAEDIKKHTEQLQAWEKEREEQVREQVQEIKNKMRIQALGEKLREIQVKETKLRFFEDHDQIMQSILNAPLTTRKKIKERNLEKYGKKISWK